MHYHKGLVRQQGHGFGALLGLASKVAGPLISGLLGGAPAQQPQPYPVYQEPYYDDDRPSHSYRRRRRGPRRGINQRGGFYAGFGKDLRKAGRSFADSIWNFGHAMAGVPTVRNPTEKLHKGTLVQELTGKQKGKDFSPIYSNRGLKVP